MRASIEKMKAALRVGREGMVTIVKTGATYERQNHPYRNRTGTLNRSTRAVAQRASRDDWQVDLEAGRSPEAPYAAYVRARGLMVIDQAAEDVTHALQSYFEQLQRNIARL